MASAYFRSLLGRRTALKVCSFLGDLGGSRCSRSSSSLRDLGGREPSGTPFRRFFGSRASSESGFAASLAREMRKPINRSRVVIDGPGEKVEANWSRAIHDLRSCCYRAGKRVDVSRLFGPGQEVYTTGFDGTFYLEIESESPVLEFPIMLRNLYVRGWRGANGSFELDYSGKESKNYLLDENCKRLDFSVNYDDLFPKGIDKASTGLYTLRESFNKLWEYRGGKTEGLRVHRKNRSSLFRTSEISVKLSWKSWIACWQEALFHLIEIGDLKFSITELVGLVRVLLVDAYNHGEFDHSSAPKPSEVESFDLFEDTVGEKGLHTMTNKQKKKYFSQLKKLRKTNGRGGKGPKGGGGCVSTTPPSFPKLVETWKPQLVPKARFSSFKQQPGTERLFDDNEGDPGLNMITSKKRKCQLFEQNIGREKKRTWNLVQANTGSSDMASSKAEQLINEVLAEADAGSSGNASGGRRLAQPGAEQFQMKIGNNKVGLVIGKGGKGPKGGGGGVSTTHHLVQANTGSSDMASSKAEQQHNSSSAGGGHGASIPPLSSQSSTPQYSSYGGNQGTSKKIEIPSGRVGVIIGKGGETIRYLQLQSGAKIQVTRDNEAEPGALTRPVELQGTPEQISKAEQLINEILAEADAGSSGNPSGGRILAQPGAEQFQMKIGNDKVGLVIGKGGETIKSMQAKSGAQIKVIPLHLPPGDPSTERTMYIDGTKQQIEIAKQLVNEVISNELNT
ncbi:hypothetical protein EJB05_24920, partial [Eragrostis curvula]